MARRPMLRSSSGKPDRISYLPDDVALQILSNLPLKEAIQTSFLSSHWRSRWAKLPSLDFDDNLKIYDTRHFSYFVEKVLLHHHGPLDSFKLSTGLCIDQNKLDQWLLHLSVRRESIKEIILELPQDQLRQLVISSRLFCCVNLTNLELYDVALNFPSKFEGLRMLKALSIKKVSFPRYTLEQLIRLSPLLERLSIRDLEYHVGFLKIDAPRLQYLKLRSSRNIMDVELGNNTVNLTHVLLTGPYGGRSYACPMLLKSFFMLPRIKRLEIEDQVLESAGDSLLKGLPQPCQSLNFLSITIRVSDVDEVLATKSILRSSPALQQLEVVFSHHRNNEAEEEEEREATLWLNDDTKQHLGFTQLQLLKVTGFSGVKAELDFINFISLSSPCLRELEISFHRNLKPSEDYSPLDCTLTQLQLLKVTGFYCEKSEVELVKYLLSVSPALEQVQVLFREFKNDRDQNRYKNKKRRLDDGAAWGGDEENSRKCTLTQLRRMEVIGFCGVLAELWFIKFLVSSSPMLDRLSIQPASNSVPWTVSKQLNEFIKSNLLHVDVKLLDPLNPAEESDDDDYRVRSPSPDSDSDSFHYVLF